MISLISFQLNADLSGFATAMERAPTLAESAVDRAARAFGAYQANIDAAAAASASSIAQVGFASDAANDAIARSATSAADSIGKIGSAVDQIDTRSWAEKFGNGLGQGFGTGYATAQTWLDQMQEFVETKVKVIAIAVAAGVSVAAVSAVYAAYKVAEGTVNFVSGLFTGDSYKSANIDALIAMNSEVKQLQENLGIAAPRASALGEALKSVGIAQSDYLSMIDRANGAVRTNTDELDRLGVKYKDADGALLPLIETQRNALDMLDQYKEGWDRQQAAAAMAMGSYEQLQAAVQVTEQQVGTSMDRLQAYTLVVGPGTQEAVNSYEKAMKAFNRELDLTSQGFKRAIADQIMPLFTDLADFFKEGFPFAVRAFRYSIGTVTALFYGLKESTYIVTEGIIQSFGAVADVVSRVAKGIGLAIKGDFQGAWDTIMATPDDLTARWEKYVQNISAASDHNLKAIQQALGFDSFAPQDAIAQYEASQRGKKTFSPAPAKAKDVATVRIADDPEKALLDGQLRYLDSAIASEQALLASREQMLKTYYDRGTMNAAEYYERLEAVRTDALDAVRGTYAAESALLDGYAAKQVEGSQKAIEAAGKLSEVNDKLAKAMQTGGLAQMKTWLEQDSRSAAAGFNRAMGQVAEGASNMSRMVESATVRAFGAMEDAVVRFAQTGKLSVADMANAIIADIVRIQVRQAMSPWLSAIGNGIAGMLGFSSPAASSSSYDLVGSSGGSLSSMGGAQGLTYGGGRATGGPVVPGSLYEVAENGPELLTAGGRTFLMVGQHAGQVTPAAGVAAGAGGSGAGVGTVRVEIRNEGRPQQVAQATTRFDAEGMVVQILTRDIATDGPVAQAMSRQYGLNRAAGACG